MRPSKEQTFNKMGQNSDGGIDITEMQTVSEKMTELSSRTANADDPFSQYDSDGNGLLSQDETDTAAKPLRKGVGQYGALQGGIAAGSMPPPLRISGRGSMSWTRTRMAASASRN
jgi:hypothetical protein